MPIHITTVYTKERLRAFINYSAASKKLFWSIMIVCTALMVALLILSAMLDILTPTLITGAIFLGWLDFLYIFAFVILPRIMLKKSKQLNTVVEYAFDESHFEMHAHSDYMDDTSTIKYAALHKAAKKGSSLYLYPNRTQAFIVDLTALSEEQNARLKAILELHFKPQKIKWSK